jgi:hypothetical protein
MREIDCAHSRSVKTNTFRENEPLILQLGKNSFHALSKCAIKIEKNHKNHMLMRYKRLIFTKNTFVFTLRECAQSISRIKILLKCLILKKIFLNSVICGRSSEVVPIILANLRLNFSKCPEIEGDLDIRLFCQLIMKKRTCRFVYGLSKSV